ncbi:hypothetical protein JQC92_08595 [Shewanella sp. 202IG2-18]|uniref:hypothetical protein n=1 Tax=Parashewanella hymeniacidonis TaxID=2807618 RepID=UPI00195FF96F|nr:hypothetical protein [Parashewanella hymeniacidonis]MBM7072085.1 hypothetical protein [Parashewanella hymeniacidonis]
MTNFNRIPSAELSSTPMKNHPLSQLSLHKLSTPQLTGHQPLIIKGAHYFIDPLLLPKVSSSTTFATSQANIQPHDLFVFSQGSFQNLSLTPQFKQLLLTMPLLPEHSALHFLGFGNVKGCYLYFCGKKFQVKEKAFNDTTVVVELDSSSKQVKLTTMNLVASLPLIEASNSSVPLNQTQGNPNHSYFSLLNSLFNKVIQRNGHRIELPSSNNRLTKRIRNLGASNIQSELTQQQPHETIALANILKIPRLKNLLSWHQLQTELTEVSVLRPADTNASTTLSFAQSIKFIWQLLLLKSDSSHANSSSIQALKQNLYYQQHIELERIFEIDDLHVFDKVKNKIIQYQSASHFSDDKISWFFGLPYWQQNQLEYFEGHYLQERNNESNNELHAWKLTLKFNISLGSLLVTVKSNHSHALTIELSSNHAALIDKINVFVSHLISKVEPIGFKVNSITVIQKTIPISLLSDVNAFIKVST